MTATRENTKAIRPRGISAKGETASSEEAVRQYAFMEKTKALVDRKSREVGRPLTAAVVTFGCQVNTEHGTGKAA